MSTNLSDDILHVYTKDELLQFCRRREGEQKLGETVQSAGADWRLALKQSSARFVLLGVPEDIGVRANHGRPGAHTAWKPALESFLSQQDNPHLQGKDLLVLGELELGDLMQSAEGLSFRNRDELKHLRELVSQIDERLSSTIRAIVSSGKIPIVVGGGHNNAYGNLKGASEALQRRLNCINCDPHLDFRALEGRHSGNGFSYAYRDAYLDKYAVLCMHEQYNNREVLNQFRSEAQRLYYNSYEEVFVRASYSFEEAIQKCLSFLGDGPLGLELDLDAITNVPSSAKTSSGLSPLEARRYIHAAAASKQVVYLHLAEAAPVLSHIKADNKTGKLIAYLISDFIKSRKQLD